MTMTPVTVMTSFERSMMTVAVTSTKFLVVMAVAMMSPVVVMARIISSESSPSQVRAIGVRC